MDKFGVPKKVNRHVIKAVNRLTDGCEKTNFSNICDVVQDTMKNLVPTPNFHNSVRLSLQNFCKLGVFEKKAKGYYSPVDAMEALEALPRSSAVKPKVFTKTEKKERKSNLNPNRKKRRIDSDDSIPENDPNKPIKRQRVDKSLNRKGHRAHLPKVRVHHHRHDDQMFDQLDEKQPSENEEINIPFSSRSEPRLNFTGFEALISVEAELVEDINIDSIQMGVNSQTLSSDIPDCQQESTGCSVLFQSTNSLASSVCETENQKESQNEPESSQSQNEEEKSKVVVKTEHNSEKQTNTNTAAEHDSSSENKS